MPRKKQEARKCTVDGCTNDLLARGYCSMHYSRARKGGEFVGLLVAKGTNQGLCMVAGCEKPAYGRGYCQKHYDKVRKYGDPLGAARRRSGVGTVCSVVGCSGEVRALGYCAKHHSMFKKHGDATFQSEQTKKRHGEIFDDQGYVLVWAPGHPNAKRGTANKRVPKHRLVMCEYLGRSLLPGENVHHKNGDKCNNGIDNLELWVTTQPKGQRPQDLLEWAREIVARYAADEQKFITLNGKHKG